MTGELTPTELTKVVAATRQKPWRTLCGIACQPRYYDVLIASAHVKGTQWTPGEAWGVKIIKDPELLTPWLFFHDAENWETYRKAAR